MAALAVTSASGRAPALIEVRDESAFAAAAAALRGSGGTIVLRPGSYDELVVGPRSSRRLRIVGSRGVRVQRILLDRTQYVSLERLRVSPLEGDGGVDVRASSHVELDRVLVTAAGTPFRVGVTLPNSTDVVIRRSVFTHCGDRSPAWANCLLLSWVKHLTVEDSWFHDCYGCDFVHGRWALDLRLLRNRFERALPCRIGRVRCGHQDLVEVFAGNGLTVIGNHFGVYEVGGAQLYLTNAIDHVRVENNVFIGSDPLVPGYRSRVAMIIGSRGFLRVPHDVVVVNNTILTGAPRNDGYAGSIRMSSMYGAVPRRERPVLANNIIGLLEVPQHVCAEAQASIANVVLAGTGCSSSDRVGDPRLDVDGRPTAASTLVIDRGSRRYAPAIDVTGRPRGREPDIGAYEFR